MRSIVCFLGLVLISFLADAQNAGVYQTDFKILYESYRDDHPLRAYHIDSLQLLKKYDSLNALIHLNTTKDDFFEYCEILSNAMHCKHTFVYDPLLLKKIKEPSSAYITKYQKHSAYLYLSDFDGGKSTIRHFFKKVHQQNIDTVVIDLRSNPGGNGNIGNYFLKYVLPKEYKHYLSCNVHESKQEEYYERRAGLLISNQYTITGDVKTYYFSVKPTKKSHYNGVIYLLINEHTLSTATYVSSYLKHVCKAKVIGVETAENEYMLGGGVIRTLNLPASGLKVKFPLYAWVYGSLETPSKTGVKPTDTALPLNLKTLVDK